MAGQLGQFILTESYFVSNTCFCKCGVLVALGMIGVFWVWYLSSMAWSLTNLLWWLLCIKCTWWSSIVETANDASQNPHGNWFCLPSYKFSFSVDDTSGVPKIFLSYGTTFTVVAKCFWKKVNLAEQFGNISYCFFFF